MRYNSWDVKTESKKIDKNDMNKTMVVSFPPYCTEIWIPKKLLTKFRVQNWHSLVTLKAVQTYNKISQNLPYQANIFVVLVKILRYTFRLSSPHWTSSAFICAERTLVSDSDKCWRYQCGGERSTYCMQQNFNAERRRH